MEFRFRKFHTGHDNHVNRSNCKTSLPSPPTPPPSSNEKSSQKFHSPRNAPSNRAYFHVNYFRISFFTKMFRWKRKEKKKKMIFSNERRIFNIFHPRYRRVTFPQRPFPRYFPSFSPINFMQIHRRISITTITTRIGPRSKLCVPAHARNLSALIINAMFNAYFAMLITRLTPTVPPVETCVHPLPCTTFAEK